ncbi:MAG TPA: hypothetical protein VNF68_06235 [Candidatus Baltobacteraceae bacterium]|nr:hypothetical protein [Candidatus Baltobacteraceae bacterium]
MRELERALLDIAEVRDRLAQSQRFKGYSGIAAAASGCFALAAGTVQAVLVPLPVSAHDGRIYFSIWLICCAASLVLNYGAIAHWFASDASARERWQTRTVGLALLPALLLGAALSFALVAEGAIRLLPGVWFGCYGVGLMASRAMIPRGAIPIAAALLLAGAALLFTPAQIALAWWVMPIGFGLGQIAIGAMIFAEREKAV